MYAKYKKVTTHHTTISMLCCVNTTVLYSIYCVIIYFVHWTNKTKQITIAKEVKEGNESMRGKNATNITTFSVFIDECTQLPL